MLKIQQKLKPFLTRIDVAILLCVIAVFAAVGVGVKLFLQRDTYVTVELLASGGEWWWGTPPPYYWNTSNIAVGVKEYDTFNKPVVEVVDLVKYLENDRQFMWMKVRLRVQRNYLTKQYLFRQESLQIGKTINIAPNNIALIGQIVGIEGVGSLWNPEYIILTGKAQAIQPWESSVIEIGDKVLDNKGQLIAEILDKHVEQADVTTVDWTGEPLPKKDPRLQDVVVKMRIRVMKSGDMRYFNYYQPITIGTKMRIQFTRTAIEVNIMSSEKDASQSSSL